jgi:hypothetical protein
MRELRLTSITAKGLRRRANRWQSENFLYLRLEHAVNESTMSHEELVAQANQNLADFLKVDLGLGMEFAKRAQMEKQSGDIKGYERNMHNVMRVLDTIDNFEKRLHPEYKQEIERLRAELALFVSTI